MTDLLHLDDCSALQHKMVDEQVRDEERESGGHSIGVGRGKTQWEEKAAEE